MWDEEKNVEGIDRNRISGHQKRKIDSCKTVFKPWEGTESEAKGKKQRDRRKRKLSL